MYYFKCFPKFSVRSFWVAKDRTIEILKHVTRKSLPLSWFHLNLFYLNYSLNHIYLIQNSEVYIVKKSPFTPESHSFVSHPVNFLCLFHSDYTHMHVIHTHTHICKHTMHIVLLSAISVLNSVTSVKLSYAFIYPDNIPPCFLSTLNYIKEKIFVWCHYVWNGFLKCCNLLFHKKRK